jgi:hypothetical protein
MRIWSGWLLHVVRQITGSIQIQRWRKRDSSGGVRGQFCICRARTSGYSGQSWVDGKNASSPEGFTDFPAVAEIPGYRKVPSSQSKVQIDAQTTTM